MCLAKRAEESFRGRSDKRSIRVRRAVGALRARGVFVPEPPVKRGRGGRTSDEPRKWTYPFAAWMACVFERGGEVSARSRREARARGVRGERIPRLYDAQSGVASNISLRLGGRAGDRASGGGGLARTFWAATTF